MPRPELHARVADRRYRFEHLNWTDWPTTPMVVVNWYGHGQEFVPWPEEDGRWVLLPVEPM